MSTKKFSLLAEPVGGDCEEKGCGNSVGSIFIFAATLPKNGAQTPAAPLTEQWGRCHPELHPQPHAVDRDFAEVVAGVAVSVDSCAQFLDCDVISYSF